jgi:hypothetical protein
VKTLEPAALGVSTVSRKESLRHGQPYGHSREVSRRRKKHRAPDGFEGGERRIAASGSEGKAHTARGHDWGGSDDLRRMFKRAGGGWRWGG